MVSFLLRLLIKEWCAVVTVTLPSHSSPSSPSLLASSRYILAVSLSLPLSPSLPSFSLSLSLLFPLSSPPLSSSLFLSLSGLFAGFVYPLVYVSLLSIVSLLWFDGCGLSCLTSSCHMTKRLRLLWCCGTAATLFFTVTWLPARSPPSWSIHWTWPCALPSSLMFTGSSCRLATSPHLYCTMLGWIFEVKY